MERNELFALVDEAVEKMGQFDFIDAIIQQMSTQELELTLRFIDRMNDLELFQE